MKELVARYNELVELARQRKLPADATGGSIATVTNFGTFGLTWATPIPLPEQTLVLGMGAGRKVPHWDEAKGQFVPVMEANLTLSFDHRVLDGGAAGRLLARICLTAQVLWLETLTAYLAWPLTARATYMQQALITSKFAN